MREVKEKSSLKARSVETLKSAPQAAFRRGTDASFQQLRQELREAAARSQTPPTMPCRKSAIWQKRQPTSCRKQNPNRSGKPGRNLFPNTNVRSPSILLRNRKNIRRKTSHREISLCVNRLLQSGRSRFLRQATSNQKCESIHRPLMRLCSSPSIQLRRFMKT